MAGKKVFGLNQVNPASHALEHKEAAKVAVFGLASDFGCQVQMTNIEKELLDVLGMFELVYWQLVSSAPLPEDFDIAIIEGAVCTQEHVETLQWIRERAKVVIAIGACAVTGGIPGLARGNVDDFAKRVYGDVPASCGSMASPRPVSDIIAVDFTVPGCPIEPLELVAVLQRALMGGNPEAGGRSMCGDCRLNEDVCFFERGSICLGLVTRAGCGAPCIKLGYPCNGCRGLAASANLDSARDIVAGYGLDVADFDARLQIFNKAGQDNPRS